MDTDRNGMLAKTGTYDHMLLSFFKFPTTEWWKEQVLRTGETMVLIQTQNSSVIMPGKRQRCAEGHQRRGGQL